MSPTARSLKLLRERGYMVDVVEKTIPKTFIKKDLWGCIDILGISPSGKLIAVQTTSDATGGNMGMRIRKCQNSAVLPMWKAGGHRFEVHGWRKLKQGNRVVWQPKIEEL